jgi:hypothetical protein
MLSSLGLRSQIAFTPVMPRPPVRPNLPRRCLARLLPLCGPRRPRPCGFRLARALGVRIEREFAVGSYDIQMLSARQSDGLAEFLRGEGYKLPAGAEGALEGYVRGGMKFFVAKVNLPRHSAKAEQEQEPLQIRF